MANSNELQTRLAEVEAGLHDLLTGRREITDQLIPALNECLRMQPRIIANRKYTVVYDRAADAEHILDGLRNAGWKG